MPLPPTSSRKPKPAGLTPQLPAPDLTHQQPYAPSLAFPLHFSKVTLPWASPERPTALHATSTLFPHTVYLPSLSSVLSTQPTHYRASPKLWLKNYLLQEVSPRSSCDSFNVLLTPLQTSLCHSLRLCLSLRAEATWSAVNPRCLPPRGINNFE